MPMGYGQLQDKAAGTSRALQARYGLDPDFNLSMMPELALVTAPFFEPELYYHSGVRRWQVGRRVAGVAAQAARCSLRVIDTSASIVIVDAIELTCEAATEFTGDFGYGPASLDLGTLVTTFEFRDGRTRPSAGGGSVIVSHETNVAALSAQACDASTLASTIYRPPGGPWVLFPGNQMMFGVTALNTPFAYTFCWRERPLGDTENTV